ncbi:hypothetical protein LguiB_031642 [Lonicera macranthoides]
MNVPKPFWADAFSTACFLINRMPSSILRDKTPYSVLFPTKSLFPIEPRIFGSTCFVRDVRPQVTKLDPKCLKCVFLGYSRIQKGYRCYCPSLNKYLVSADVTFMEETPYFPPSTSESKGEDDDLLVYTVTLLELIAEPVPVRPPIHQVYSRRRPPDPCPPPASSSLDSVTSDDLPIALRKGKRQCTYPVSSCVSYDYLSPTSCSFIASLDSIFAPKTVHEAISHPGWRNAMIEEMDALDTNGTWDLVTLPARKQAIGCK